jgi:putative membrane protein insertion efficiency factor
MANARALFRKIITFPFYLVIRVYQLIVSPIWPSACRFEPTCSHYAIEAFRKRGLFVGFYLMVKRIARCHPWGGFGYDPVPDQDLSSSEKES